MRRTLFIWCLFLSGIACLSQSEAFWQSRDSNYNVNIASSAQTPATIFGANLYAWYYADRGGVTQVAGVVSAVTDQSSSGLNLAVNNVGPTWSSSSFNSQPGVTHTQAVQSGLISATNNINSANASFFIVMNIPGTNPGRVLSYTDGAGDFNQTFTILAGRIPSSTGGYGAVQDNVVAGSATIYTGNQCFGTILGGGNLTMFTGTSQVDQQAISNTLGSAATQVVLGLDGNGTADFTWAEVVITNNAATSGQRTSLISYFNSHWGLSC